MPRKSNRSDLAKFTLTDLQKELETREAAIEELQATREEVLDELAEIDAELARLTGQAGGKATNGRRKSAKKATGGKKRGGKRASGGLTLGDALHKALQGKQLTTAEAEEAIKKVGYNSSSPNIRNMIGQQFSLDKKRFKRVERGVYTAK